MAQVDHQDAQDQPDDRQRVAPELERQELRGAGEHQHAGEPDLQGAEAALAGEEAVDQPEGHGTGCDRQDRPRAAHGTGER